MKTKKGIKPFQRTVRRFGTAVNPGAGEEMEDQLAKDGAAQMTNKATISQKRHDGHLQNNENATTA